MMPADIQRLIDDLSATDPTTRAQAAEALSRLGPEAAPAAVALVRACGDESEEVREYAVSALEEMGTPNAEDVVLLAALLVGAEPDVGYWAATLLGRMESAAAPAVPALATAVADCPNTSVRQRAAWALGQIGPLAVDAMDALRRVAAGDDPRLARLAQRAIGQIEG